MSLIEATTPPPAYLPATGPAVRGDTSYEFVIDAGIHQQLRYDTLDYLNLARSGTAIEESVVGAEYA